jgi:hypothetical protein
MKTNPPILTDDERNGLRARLNGRQHPCEPPLRDILTREYNEAQKRPRNEAWEKWGPSIKAMIQGDMERRTQLAKKLPSPERCRSIASSEPDIER